MLNVQSPDRHTLSYRTRAKRSPEEHMPLYAYAAGPDDLEAVLAGLSDPDLDRTPARGQWTIRQIVDHVVEDDALWTMRMQVALARPGHTYRPDRCSGNGAGVESWLGAEEAVAPVVTLFRANRTHILTLLHHLPDVWDRYVTCIDAAEQDARTVTVGHAVWIQATHALKHITEIRELCCMHGR